MKYFRENVRVVCVDGQDNYIPVEELVCPFCESFLSIQNYIYLLSDYSVCGVCINRIHVPSLLGCLVPLEGGAI